MATLDATTASKLDIPPEGGLLLRPDGHGLLRITALDTPPHTRNWLTYA